MTEDLKIFIVNDILRGVKLQHTVIELFEGKPYTIAEINEIVEDIKSGKMKIDVHVHY